MCFDTDPHRTFVSTRSLRSRLTSSKLDRWRCVWLDGFIAEIRPPLWRDNKKIFRLSDISYFSLLNVNVACTNKSRSARFPSIVSLDGERGLIDGGRLQLQVGHDHHSWAHISRTKQGKNLTTMVSQPRGQILARRSTLTPWSQFRLVRAPFTENYVSAFGRNNNILMTRTASETLDSYPQSSSLNYISIRYPLQIANLNVKLFWGSVRILRWN